MNKVSLTVIELEILSQILFHVICLKQIHQPTISLNYTEKKESYSYIMISTVYTAVACIICSRLEHFFPGLCYLFFFFCTQVVNYTNTSSNESHWIRIFLLVWVFCFDFGILSSMTSFLFTKSPFSATSSNTQTQVLFIGQWMK